MALFNEWQAQRQQRQQELRSRQQQVSQDLAGFQQNRADMGRAMRQSLSDYHGQIRRETQEISQQTQLFLSNCQDRRFQETQALMQALDHFYQTLAAETAQFLTHVTQDRVTMATQQTKELQDFHHDLNGSVTEFLDRCHHQRLEMKAELTEYLSNFITQLCADVGVYLQELNLQRDQMAQELQEMFHSDRLSRSQTMQGLYDRLANLRLQRQQDIVTLQTEMWRHVKADRANLFDRVWGTLPTANVPSSSAKLPNPPSVTAPSPTAAPSSVVSANPGQTPPTSTPPAPTTPLPVTPSPAPFAVPQQPPQATSQSSSAIMQKAVYEYIQQVKSARLKDIEENLNINRVQAVNILRILMAKGLVSQNSREYLVVETN